MGVPDGVIEPILASERRTRSNGDPRYGGLVRTSVTPLLVMAFVGCGRTPARAYSDLRPEVEGRCVSRPAEASPETRLVDPGRAPRAPLAFAPGSERQRVRISESAHDGVPARVLVVRFDAPRSSATKACFPFELEMQDVHVDASIENGGLTIDPSGTDAATTCCATQSKTDAVLSAYVERSLTSVELGFPREPIGEGAIWVRERPAALAAVLGSRSVTFELVNRLADRATLEITVEDAETAGSESNQAGGTLRGAGRFTFAAGVPVPLGTIRWVRRPRDGEPSVYETTFVLATD